MILLVALALAKDPCARTEEEQGAFTAHLEALNTLSNEAKRALADGSTTKDVVSGPATKEVLASHKKGELCTADDRFWAAMVLLQATELGAVEVAWELAQGLLAERYPRGAWIAGQAYDRWSVAYGRMQAYGTQTSAVNGRRCLLWVDPQFTDEQRKAYGYPTLEATAAQILELNGAKGAPATVAELKKRELWCKPEPWDGRRSDLQDPYGR